MIFLAGCILSCFLQLVPAQRSLTIISAPQYPIEGQNVLLIVQGVPAQFERCEWTLPSRSRITFSPEEDSGQKTGTAEQAVTVYQNCSLSIRNLRQSTAGNYSVTITVHTANKQDQTNEEIYKGSIFVIMFSKINIIVEPPILYPGQNVKLIPDLPDLPERSLDCEWSQTTQSGIEKEIQTSRKHQNQQQITIQQDCSLHITKLTVADSGNYSVLIQHSPDQNSRPGKGSEDQRKYYKGQVALKVIGQSIKDPQTSSASMKYSAGILAGVLFGSLTWTTAPSLFSLLICMFSLVFSKP